MTSTTNSPSSWETTASSSESAADHQYKRVFEAREVTVVTNAMAVTADDARDKMFGVTEKTWNWLEKERDKVPSNYSRPALFPNWDKLPPGLQIRSRDEANQHRQSLARRDAPYADHTYAALRANDVQNAMDWYNDIVDLSEMEDSVKSNPAQRFTKKCHDRPAKIRRPHYDTRALSGLYFLLMDVVDDGRRNGFIRTTNERLQKTIEKKNMATNMLADERVRKSIIVDLLGPYAKDNILDFVYCPLAYLAIKRGDHKVNESRKLTQAAKQQLHASLKTMSKEERDAAQSTYPRPWSALPATSRPPCLYPSWSALAACYKITHTHAASAYFSALDVRDPPLAATPDPQLDDVIQIKHILGRWLYNCLASVHSAQDNATSHAFRDFVGTPNPADAARRSAHIRNMQAWAYLLADRHVDDASLGRLVPRTDGAAEPELRRSGKKFLLANVMYGRADAFVNVFERVGATGVVLMREKSLAQAFLGNREADIRMADLVYEPFAFMATRAAHRRSNAARKRRLDGGGNGGGDNGGDDGPDDGQDGGDGGPPQKRKSGGKRKRDDADSNTPGSDGSSEEKDSEAKRTRTEQDRTDAAADEIPEDVRNHDNQTSTFPGIGQGSHKRKRDGAVDDGAGSDRSSDEGGRDGKKTRTEQDLTDAVFDEPLYSLDTEDCQDGGAGVSTDEGHGGCKRKRDDSDESSPVSDGSATPDSPPVENTRNTKKTKTQLDVSGSVADKTQIADVHNPGLSMPRAFPFAESTMRYLVNLQPAPQYNFPSAFYFQDNVTGFVAPTDQSPFAVGHSTNQDVAIGGGLPYNVNESIPELDFSLLHESPASSSPITPMTNLQNTVSHKSPEMASSGHNPFTSRQSINGNLNLSQHQHQTTSSMGLATSGGYAPDSMNSWFSNQTQWAPQPQQTHVTPSLYMDQAFQSDNGNNTSSSNGAHIQSVYAASPHGLPEPAHSLSYPTSFEASPFDSVQQRTSNQNLFTPNRDYFPTARVGNGYAPGNHQHY